MKNSESRANLSATLQETLVIETEVEPDTAIRDAALGDEAPENLLQDLIKVHAAAPVSPRSSSLLDVLPRAGRYLAPGPRRLSAIWEPRERLRYRTPETRLAFALQLCVLRYPGRVLRHGEIMPMH